MENKWDKLSMRQRADLIKLFVKNGVTSLDDMRQQYNSYDTGGFLDGPDDPPDIVKLIKRDVETVRNNPNIAVDNLKPTYDPGKPVSVTNYPASGTLAKDKITLAAETLPATIASGLPSLAGKATVKVLDYLGNPATTTVRKVLKSTNPKLLTKAANTDTFINVVQSALGISDVPNLYKNVKNENYKDAIWNALNVFQGVAGLKGLKNPRTEVPIKTENVPLDIPDFQQQIEAGLQRARSYKQSPEYEELIKSTGKRASSQGFLFNEDFFRPTQREQPHIVIQKRDKGKLGGYNYYYNELRFDPSQFDNPDFFDLIPYHEGLHWQRVGEINSPHENMLTNSTRRFMDQEIDRVLYKDAKAYLREPSELQVNGLEAGEAVGIKPFEKYPGYEEAIEKLEQARKYNSYLWDVKAGTEEEVKDFWKLLTGNFLPASIPVGVGLGMYSNSKK